LVLLVGTALLVAIALAGGALYTSASRFNTDQQYFPAHIAPGVTGAVRLLVSYVDEQSALRAYLLTGQPRALRSISATQKQIPGLQSQLARNVDLFPGGRRALRALVRDHRRWEVTYLDPALALIAKGDRAQAQQLAETPQSQAQFEKVRDDFVPLGAAVTDAQADNHASVQRVEGLLIALLIVSLVALASIVVLGMWLMVRRITRPIDRVTAEAAALAAGDAGPVAGRRLGEFARLDEYTETIRSQLAAHRLRSHRATEALWQQGPSVAALAKALEPREQSVANVAASCRLDPAHGLLAGDWYDLLAVDRNRLAVVVGDVSGHGPDSAVLALRLRELLTAALLEGSLPGPALGRVANANAQGAPELFATIFCAVIDTDTETLQYANGGHPPALVHDPQASQDVVQLGPTGPLLSPIMAGSTWSVKKLGFSAGWGLLVVTDGALERQGPDGVHYGLERVAIDLRKLAADNPESLVDRLAERLDRFAGTVSRDDRTLVYCRHVPRPATERDAYLSERPG
jgi:sigma-B regulation protein RsbU (phosphoserine phosphatase)